ncbi:MAG: DUF4003 family protein [Microlunatus sp.]|nr:DUF4003 family protein [Microlunatus sp.]
MSIDSPDTRSKLTLFAENARSISREFRFQNALTRRLAALLYAQENRPLDAEAIRRCHHLMKQNTGVFSSFRGPMAMGVAALLSLSPAPERLFASTLEVYDLLKQARLRTSDFLAVAAFQIAARTEPGRYPGVVDRTRAFYDGMRAQRFFLTGQDDYIFAAMLGLSELDTGIGTQRIGQVYDRLKGEFRGRNSVQSLAQVLVLGDSDLGAADRVLALRDALRAQRIRLDRSYTLPTLGVLALLPVQPQVIAADIGRARDFLRSQRGFGRFSVQPQELLLYATGVVADGYARDVRAGVLTATISTSITNLIIAQQTAMIVVLTANAGATAATS